MILFLLQDLWTYIHGWGTTEQKQQALKVLQTFGEHGAKAPEKTDITYEDLDSVIVSAYPIAKQYCTIHCLREKLEKYMSDRKEKSS